MEIVLLIEIHDKEKYLIFFFSVRKFDLIEFSCFVSEVMCRKQIPRSLASISISCLDFDTTDKLLKVGSFSPLVKLLLLYSHAKNVFSYIRHSVEREHECCLECFANFEVKVHLLQENIGVDDFLFYLYLVKIFYNCTQSGNTFYLTPTLEIRKRLVFSILGKELEPEDCLLPKIEYYYELIKTSWYKHCECLYKQLKTL